MLINIRKEIGPLKIKEFGLPNFVVLTGENGAGKSLLLDLLHRQDGVSAFDDDQTQIDRISLAPQGFVLRKENKDSEEVIQKLQQRWGKVKAWLPLVEAHLYKESLQPADINEIYESFVSIFGALGQQVSLTEIPSAEIVAGFRLCKLVKKHAVQVTFEDFFTFEEFDQGSVYEWSLPLVFKQYELRKKNYPDLVEPVAPWDVFNSLLAAAKFRYEVVYRTDEHGLSDRTGRNVYLTPYYFKHLESGMSVDISWLSSGEHALLSLVTVLFNSQSGLGLPEILLLDEPDAFLHPSLAFAFLDAVQKILVEDLGIKVVMTTHSPSTVAMSPKDSIYLLERKLGYPRAVDRDIAIRSLTSGIATLTVAIEDRKQLFTEAEKDAKFYQKVFETFIRREVVPKDQWLTFIPCGLTKKEDLPDDAQELSKALDQVEKAGCDRVIGLTNALFNDGLGNRHIFGLIDWDGKNQQSDRVIVFGGSSRYSLENYIYDPLFLALFGISDVRKPERKGQYGLDADTTNKDFHNYSNHQLQSVIDKICNEIKPNVVFRDIDHKSDDPVDMELINGAQVSIPRWFLDTRGHDIDTAIRKTFLSLSKKPMNEFVDHIVIPNYEFLPVQVKSSIEMMQGLLVHRPVLDTADQ